jgi:hypothetical protein
MPELFAIRKKVVYLKIAKIRNLPMRRLKIVYREPWSETMSPCQDSRDLNL